MISPPKHGHTRIVNQSLFSPVRTRETIGRRESLRPVSDGLAHDAPKFRRKKIHRSKTAPPSQVNKILHNLPQKFSGLR
eukprot:TRINITY_DN2332_c0_g1_i1.p1 TRINITY_DN2332_c0_g1~~TRINITY_DN2332_c0_g1_i1.p1  ORF type:complete len:79 (+),score=1.28 TRINITY_DN2332_c0_g1_i1:52-288(+)